MARSPLTTLLRRMHAAHLEAEMRAVPADIVFEEQKARGIARRDFLAGASALAAFGLLPMAPRRFARALAASSTTPRIVIVGG
ncbi:MAG TPA: hypothetical protein VEJ20_09760, partial [Candidatus Eremiobacteraceae bacterium]|nr:hypothetical protein [Candidatus Eremiobacteraceae bacterium]